MKIKELRKAWDQLSTESQERSFLNEDQIRDLLGKQSKNLIERTDFNIRTLFLIVIFVFSGLLIYDILLITGMVAAGSERNDPGWYTFTGLIVHLLIIGLFTAFTISYFHVRRQHSEGDDLRNSLFKIIRILSFYRKLFTILLAVYILDAAASFTQGFVDQINSYHKTEGVPVSELISGIFLAFLLAGSLFLLLRWAFRKIYGNYLQGMKNTLKELDEL